MIAGRVVMFANSGEMNPVLFIGVQNSMDFGIDGLRGVTSIGSAMKNLMPSITKMLSNVNL